MKTLQIAHSQDREEILAIGPPKIVHTLTLPAGNLRVIVLEMVVRGIKKSLK